MSKKTKFFILSGLLFLSVSFYSSAAFVKANLERDVNINVSFEEPAEKITIQSLKDTFQLDENQSSKRVMVIQNNTEKTLTLPMEMTVSSDVNGNHWVMEVLTSPSGTTQILNHNAVNWMQTLTLSPHETAEIQITRKEAPNSSGKNVPIDAKFDFFPDGETITVNQTYTFVY